MCEVYKVVIPDARKYVKRHFAYKYEELYGIAVRVLLGGLGLGAAARPPQTVRELIEAYCAAAGHKNALWVRDAARPDGKGDYVVFDVPVERLTSLVGEDNGGA
mgnify:CR=1 FL=1